MVVSFIEGGSRDLDRPLAPTTGKRDHLTMVSLQ